MTRIGSRSFTSDNIPTLPSSNLSLPRRHSERTDVFGPWLTQFRQLRLAYSSETRTFECRFAPAGRACFNVDMLNDLRLMQRNISQGSENPRAPRAGTDFDFMVVGSATPGVYNLGGDLALFRKLVQGRDQDALRAYARLCVDVVRDNEVSYRAPIVTIAQVEGSCLGGGFEAALSCDVIIAEEHVKFGFPEILFGLFPGMGAINFLSRRLSHARVVDLILSGRTFSAKALLELGLIDRVVATGEAPRAVKSYIARHKKNNRAHSAVYGSMRQTNPYTDLEFDHIISEWVVVAMQLSDKQLNKMLRLADAQQRKRETSRARSESNASTDQRASAVNATSATEPA